MSTIKTTRASSRLLSRLRGDLKELINNPYPGIDVHHHPDNLRKFCLILTPLSGPYLGLRLHFDVELPETWPVDPPKVRSSSHLDHPYVHTAGYICTDLLRLYDVIPEESYTGGYTPAFTLGGLFMQILSIFSSEEVELGGGRKIRIGNRIEETYQLSHVLESKAKMKGLHNLAFSRKVLDLYLQEVRAGGGTECVYSQYNGATIWQPHSGKVFQTVKATWENKRYSTTLEKIRGVKCGDCEYREQSMPCTIPIKIPGSNDTGAISWIDIVKARKISESAKYLREKKLRNLKRRLREITLLQGRQSVGGDLEANQIYKISTYDKVIIEIGELEAQIAGENLVGPPESGNPKPLVVDSSVIEPSYNTGVCHLAILSNDILLAIAASLPSESLINFGKAYPRVYALTSEHHILLQRELRCFFLRTPLNHPTNLLGVGVYINTMGGLGSSFDWISMDAFELFKVRKSIDKKEFEFFLPLGFSIPYFDRAYESGKLFEYIDKIGAAIQKRVEYCPENSVFERNPVEERLGVLYKFCNSIITSLMRTTDDFYSKSSPGEIMEKEESEKTLLFTSEKACIRYLQIYHLLLCIMRRDPELRKRELARLKAFCSEDTNRAKSSVPDLGEFLVIAAVVAGSYNPGGENVGTHNTPSLYSEEPEENSWATAGRKQKKKVVKKAEERCLIPGNKISWREHLVNPFISEVLTRNVKWFIKKHPSLAVTDNSPPEFRMRTTFNESRTSLRLVMFQVFFLETLTIDDITRQMVDQYGFAGPEAPAMITNGIKDIYSISGWKGFFERIGLREVVKSGSLTVNKMLIDAVIRSGERGYHKAPGHSGLYRGTKSSRRARGL